ncbi:uncharacterized protein LOC106094241 [Stomoxys calcitrans]|uniref:uncharacterized protein LOC106094241 n=1 Tax=Stomoxys calcitrans TaxID=35570 RepID=UPI0027E3934E|nr:uncharacterized protein LOC106094241 [Stomoxys calcitrans]
MNFFHTLAILVTVISLTQVQADVSVSGEKKHNDVRNEGYTYPQPQVKQDDDKQKGDSTTYRHSKPKAIDDPLPEKVNYVYPVVVDFHHAEEHQWKPLFEPVFAPSYLTPKEELSPPLDKYRAKDSFKHTITRKPYSSNSSSLKSQTATSAGKSHSTTTQRTTTLKPKTTTTTRKVITTTTPKRTSTTRKTPTTKATTPRSTITTRFTTPRIYATTKKLSTTTKAPAIHRPILFEPQSMEDEYKPEMQYPAKFNAFKTGDEDMVYVNHHHGPKSSFELFNVHDEIPLLSSPPEVIFKPGDDTSFADDLTVFDDYEHTFGPPRRWPKHSTTTAKPEDYSTSPKSLGHESLDDKSSDVTANSNHGYVYEKPSLAFET